MRLAVIVFVVSMCVALALGQSTPILLFSQQNYFNEQKIQPKPFSTQQLSTFFTDLLTGSQTQSKSLLSHVSSSQLPSSVFVWTQNGLTTPKSQDILGFYQNNDKFTPIQQNYKFFIPNAVQDNASTFYRSLLITSVQSSKDFTSTTKCSDITNFITASIQSTTKNTFIKAQSNDMVTFDIFNTCLEEILNVYNQATNGNYLLIVQGTSPKITSSTFKVLQDDPQPEPEPQPEPQPTPTPQPKRVGPQYVTSQTLVAIFVVFFLGTFLIFGINTTMGIEGPLRFPVASQLPPPTREY